MVSLCDLYLHKCFIDESFLTFLVHVLVTENLKLHRTSILTSQTIKKIKINFLGKLQPLLPYSYDNYRVYQPWTDKEKEKKNANFGIPYNNKQL